MLFFHFQNLYFMASSDCKRIVKLLLLQEKNPIPELHGRSYIRNLEPLLSDEYSWQEKAEYVGVLSYRNHPSEMFYKQYHLNLDDLPPWIPLQVIEENPLIKIDKGKIVFPHENKSRAS